MFLLTTTTISPQTAPWFFNGNLASFHTVSPCRTDSACRILEATVVASSLEYYYDKKQTKNNLISSANQPDLHSFYLG